jgi:hypothetical protein
MRKKHFIATHAIVVVLAWTCAFGGTGYRFDYDYPDQGDDWHGSSAAPDPRRDFEPSPVDVHSSGDDFDTGYEARTDLLGHGPPLELTQSREFEYLFRFGSVPAGQGGDPGGCTSNAQCNDGVFCDGAETCVSGSCRSGTPPSCSDANPCTSDRCDGVLDACVNDPVGSIDEVSALFVDRAVPGLSVARLSWDPVFLADVYNLYRGESVMLGDLACSIGDIVETWVEDDGSLPGSGVFLYLVTATGCGHESTFGYGEPGERQSDAVCP